MGKEKRGRKPIEENIKKKAIQIYVEQYKIDKLGGQENTKNIILNYIEIKLTEDEKK